jgi:hypothetical protein
MLGISSAAEQQLAPQEGLSWLAFFSQLHSQGDVCMLIMLRHHNPVRCSSCHFSAVFPIDGSACYSLFYILRTWRFEPGWQFPIQSVVEFLGSICRSNSSEYRQYYFLGCDAVQSGRISPTFGNNVLFPSSGSKGKTSKQPVRSTQQGEPENGDNTLLRNVSEILVECTAAHLTSYET